MSIFRNEGSFPELVQAWHQNQHELGPLAPTFCGKKDERFIEQGLPLRYSTPHFPSNAEMVMWDLDDSLVSSSPMHSFLFRNALEQYQAASSDFARRYETELWPVILELKGKAYGQVLAGIYDIGRRFNLTTPDTLEQFKVDFDELVEKVRSGQLSGVPDVKPKEDAVVFHRQAQARIQREPVVFTAGMRTVSEMLLERAGLRREFPLLYSVEGDCENKTKNGEGSYREVINKIALDPKNVVYVGDALEEAKWAPVVFGCVLIRPHKPLGKFQLSIGDFLSVRSDVESYHSSAHYVRDLRDVIFQTS